MEDQKLQELLDYIDQSMRKLELLKKRVEEQMQLPVEWQEYTRGERG